MFSFYEQSILSCLASVSLHSTIDMFSLLLVTPQNLANCREAQYIGSPCFILCFKLRSNTFSPFCIRHYRQKANYVSDLLQTQRINIMKKNWYQSSIFLKFNASWEFLIGFLFPWTYHATIIFEPTL